MKGFSLYTFKRRSFKVSCNCRCEICCPVKVVNTKETFNLFGKRSASFREPIRCPFNVSTPPIWFIITLSKYYSYYVPLKLVLLPGLDYLPYINTRWSKVGSLCWGQCFLSTKCNNENECPLDFLWKIYA